jgi:undecaprenyl-diphosphatase
LKNVVPARRRVDVLQAIILGILQGLTEFLPVSSTAHLTLAGRAFGLIDDTRPEDWTAFLAVVQMGTLAAVVWYFWRDLLGIARGFAPGGTRDARKLGWLLVLGTLPIGIVGLLLRDVIEGPLTKDLRVIGTTLIALALLLALADRVGRRERSIGTLGWRDALLVGSVQVLSLIPGASRAGTTLTGGLFAGLTREAAARFSFLLSVPAIAASGLFELPAALALGREDVLGLLIATLAAAVSGYAAIAFMLRYLRTHSTLVFVVYRLALGAAVLAWALA